VRLLIGLADGQTVESVLLPRDGLCVSTQVGCAVGCVFCMTGRSGLLRQPWLVAGLLTYVIETFVWLRILSEADLSLAFPIASVNFLGIVLASRILLKEQVHRWQWVGAVLVTIGVAIVAGTA